MKSKITINELKEFVEDFYNYTTEISVSENELFAHYEFLEYVVNEPEYKDYKNQAIKDILYDFVFNKQAIESQIMTDLQTYEDGSKEISYIKEMYYKCKKFIDIYIEDLEKERIENEQK